MQHFRCALSQKAAAPAVERDLRKKSLLNAFQNCKTNSSAGTSTGNPNMQRNEAVRTPASYPPKRDGGAVFPAEGGSEPCSFESTTSSRTCRLVAGVYAVEPLAVHVVQRRLRLDFLRQSPLRRGLVQDERSADRDWHRRHRPCRPRGAFGRCLADHSRLVNGDHR